ncbi:MAG: hypothetical protein R2688_09255 [Fimbriimonadaceae bacterium]
MSRAEWAVGAFAWAARDNAEAAKRFDRASELAANEDDKEAKMDRAYAMAARGEDLAYCSRSLMRQKRAASLPTRFALQ